MEELKMDIHTQEQLDILKKAQTCNKVLLRELDRVCKKYRLRYYLICGTLLGAVRHRSFVPWDDDADVAMTRRDFEKLKKHAKEEWDGKEFLFVDYCDMKHGAFLDYMSRLVYMKEEVPVITFRKIHGKGRSDIENHIPLDIYILDNASDDEKKHDRQTKLLQGLYGLCMGHRAYVIFREYADQPADRKRLIKLLVSVGKWIPLKLLFMMYEVVRRWYNHTKTETYIMSNGFIFCLPWKFEKQWFAKGSKVVIDGEVFTGPADWDAYLRKQYGEYQNLPPVQYRHPTHTYGASGIYHTVDYSGSKRE